MIISCDKCKFSDRLLSWILVSTILLLTFRTTILLQLFDEGHFLVANYKYVIAMFFLLGVKAVVFRSFHFVIKSYLLCFALYFIQAILFPENTGYLDNECVYIFVIGLPMCCYVYSIDDYSILFSCFCGSLPVACFLGIIYSYLVLSEGMRDASYNMAAGFHFMLFALVGFSDYFHNHNLFRLVYAVLLSLVIIMVGSRGPVLWIGLYVLWQLMSRVSISRRVAMSVPIILLGVFFKDIFLFINDLFEQFDVHIRTLYLLANKLAEGSGRWELYEQGVQIIGDNWFTGAGIASDRAIHSYIHNFFLEIWMNFGTVLGSLVILLVLFTLYIAFVGSNKGQKNCLELYLFGGFMPLLLSGSYFKSFEFYILIGIMFGVLRNKRIKVKM